MQHNFVEGVRVKAVTFDQRITYYGQSIAVMNRNKCGRVNQCAAQCGIHRAGRDCS